MVLLIFFNAYLRQLVNEVLFHLLGIMEPL